MPVVCAGMTPNSPFSKGPGKVGEPVVLGGIRIATGDVIVADRTGTVVVPFGQIDEVIATVTRVAGLEEEMDAKVAAGQKAPPAMEEARRLGQGALALRRRMRLGTRVREPVSLLQPEPLPPHERPEIRALRIGVLPGLFVRPSVIGLLSEPLDIALARRRTAALIVFTDPGQPVLGKPVLVHRRRQRQPRRDPRRPAWPADAQPGDRDHPFGQVQKLGNQRNPVPDH